MGLRFSNGVKRMATAVIGATLFSGLGCIDDAGNSNEETSTSPDENQGLTASSPSVGRTSPVPANPETMRRIAAAAAGAACAIYVTRQQANSPLMVHPKVQFLFWSNFWSSGTGAAEFT